MLAGLVALLSLLKYAICYLVGSNRKEAPMKKQPRMLGFIVSVLETFWAIGTSYMTATLPA